MGEQQSPPFQRRQLGALLRKLRTQAGLSFEDAYRKAEISSGRLSRLENGEVAPDLPLAKYLLDLYGIPVNDWEPTLELVRAARKKAWWQSYGLSAQGYVALETAAARVRTFTLAFVPGVMQTEDYARAVHQVSLLRRSDKQMDGHIAVRMIRQRRLTEEHDRLELAAIVDEGALVRPVGGLSVMAAQLRHLLTLAQLPNVSLQVLPTNVGAHIGMAGAFTVLSFADDRTGDIAYIEHVGGAIRLEKNDQVRPCTLTFEQLRTDALNPMESVELIARLAGDG